VNGWQGEGWGHYFPVDVSIGEALGSDFDALVLPGGERAVAKLKANLHARRIINHFLEAAKPVAALGAGVALLALSPKIAGRTIAAPAAAQTELKAANAVVSEDTQEIDNNLLTASGGTDIAAWVEEALALFAETEDEQAEAA
jgi:protease I